RILPTVRAHRPLRIIDRVHELPLSRSVAVHARSPHPLRALPSKPAPLPAIRSHTRPSSPPVTEQVQLLAGRLVLPPALRPATPLWRRTDGISPRCPFRLTHPDMSIDLPVRAAPPM